MKKIIWVVLLSLLVSWNAYAERIPDMTDSVWVVKHPKKWTLNFMANGKCTYKYRDIIMRTFKDCRWKQDGNKVELTGNDGFFTLRMKVNGHSVSGAFTNVNGLADPLTGKATYINNWLTASVNSSGNSGSNNKIAKSKKICKELGFKANSGKFADCALKMMALQFDMGSKVSNNDGSSTQQIIVKQQDDFDIGDFFFGLQKIVDDNYRSTNNNNSNQGTNCRIVPKAWGADMVCR